MLFYQNLNHDNHGYHFDDHDCCDDNHHFYRNCLDSVDHYNYVHHDEYGRHLEYKVIHSRYHHVDYHIDVGDDAGHDDYLNAQNGYNLRHYNCDCSYVCHFDKHSYLCLV